MQNGLRCIVLGVVLVVLMLAFKGHAAAPLEVKNAWVRATVPGQSVAAAYMDITASSPVTLAGAASPAAARVELHSMAMESGVMKMRPLDKLELPARQMMSLKPGGKHLMLTEIRRPLKASERVTIVLTLEDAHGKKTTITVNAEVRSAAPSERHSH